MWGQVHRFNLKLKQIAFTVFHEDFVYPHFMLSFFQLCLSLTFSSGSQSDASLSQSIFLLAKTTFPHAVLNLHLHLVVLSRSIFEYSYLLVDVSLFLNFSFHIMVANLQMAPVFTPLV